MATCMATPMGLNRTSVGLKRGKMRRQGAERGRLNRTSVGLKPMSRVDIPEHRERPQSNQRGIETLTNIRSVWADNPASIEPAWD